MQPKRNHLSEQPSKQQQPYPPPPPQQTVGSGPAASRGPPPNYFQGYPGRGPPVTNYNDPSQHYPGYGPPPQSPQDRESRYDRSTITMQPPQQPAVAGFQRPRNTAYGYQQGPPPGAFPQTGAGGPPPPPNQQQQQQQQQQRPPPPGSPPTYGSPYAAQQQRSRPWGNNSDRGYEGYEATGPYTSAQRIDGRKALEIAKSKEDSGGIVQFSIIGNKSAAQLQASSAGAAAVMASTLNKRQPFYRAQPPSLPLSSQQHRQQKQKHPGGVVQRPVDDADALAYKTVEGRDGATSPSQIESNRRDDVTNMGCTCKKSKCLKLYCVCFGASVMCGVNCRCLICHNTPNHEQARKDAIRCILARNPSAFDTKFKKTAEANARAASLASANNANNSANGTINNRSLAHKLGCKCRKSFCTKKYCECYNAGVKCSGGCRCVSCKNMPPGGFGAGSKEGPPIVVPRSFGTDVMRVKQIGATTAKTAPNSEHKVMDAAQHLAFLKHASPQRTHSSRPIAATRDNSASMPSLAASSSGASSSPDDDKKSIGRPTRGKGGGVNSLLMAAYAMTELCSDDKLPTTPSKKKHAAVPFKSPKRKSSGGTVDDQFADADDECREEEMSESQAAHFEKKGPPTMTPSDLRQIKRTRVGTVEKRPPVHSSTKDFDATPRPEKPASDSSEEEDNSPAKAESEEEQQSPEEVFNKDTQMTTPKIAKQPQLIGALTPVTARCIDFQHMDVAEKDTPVEEKKEDTETMVAA